MSIYLKDIMNILVSQQVTHIHCILLIYCILLNYQSLEMEELTNKIMNLFNIYEQCDKSITRTCKRFIKAFPNFLIQQSILKYFLYYRNAVANRVRSITVINAVIQLQKSTLLGKTQFVCVYETTISTKI